MLPGDPQGAPGDYEFLVKTAGALGPVLARRPVRIGPVVTGLAFDPDILADTPEKSDPYTDQFDIREWEVGGQWYGMEIRYVLADDVAGEIDIPGLAQKALFSFETDTSAPQSERGDMVGAHPLRMADNLVKKTTEDPYEIKWEGFSDSFDAVVSQGELADAIFMDADWSYGGHEAEIAVPSEPTWGPASHPQNRRGAAPKFVAGEGKYVIRVEMGRKEDTQQVHKRQIGLEVKYCE